MVIIFKNFEVVPRTITAIEMQYYDQIQDWLNDMEITYTYGIQSMNWATIINTIVKPDPRFYFDTDEDGEKKPAGWNFLSTEGDSEEEDDEDDGDSDFGSKGEEDDSDEDDSDEDDDDDDDDSPFDEEEDDEDEEEEEEEEEV
jgi:nucleosome binding factor SPN SPT16 subunit